MIALPKTDGTKIFDYCTAAFGQNVGSKNFSIGYAESEVPGSQLDRLRALSGAPAVEALVALVALVQSLDLVD